VRTFSQAVSWQPIHLPLQPADIALLQDAAVRLRAYVDGVLQITARARAYPSRNSEASHLLAQRPVPPEIEHAEMRFFGALEHLGTLSNALVPGNAPLLFAPFTLMRTALEAAGYAAWAWEIGLPTGERAERGLRLRWANLDEVVKGTGDAAAAATRDGLGVPGGPPAAVAVLGELLPTPYGGGRLGERLYRQLAGRSHAMPWVFVGAGKDQVMADTNHSVTVLLKPNLSHLIGALEPTLSVVQMAMDRFGAIAGLGDADWWIARPTPPTW
jgi:hypothetical protein